MPTRFKLSPKAQLLIVVILITLTGSCRKVSDGEKLAKNYCSSCHVYPEPGLLDKMTWKNMVLPEMKFRMGLDFAPLWGLPPTEMEIIAKTIPHPMLSEKEWKKIEAFYLRHAPDLLKSIPARDDTLHQFRVENVHSDVQPFITLVKYDMVLNRIVMGSRRSELHLLYPTLKPDTALKLTSPPSHCTAITKDSVHLLQMGQMDPNDLYNGSLYSINMNTGNGATLIDSLNRPVHFMHADFDDDGDLDILISCFGNFTGSLLLFENNQGSFLKHEIHNLPGNIRAIVRDVNHDRLPDIVSLTTQGNEQLLLFTNQGNLNFSQETLYRFPPVFGSSHFDLSDIDGDGDEDIIYANGDNSDFSPIPKPYHGIRILSNDGKFTFSETEFLPLHGAYQFETDDFDKDGDIDIAALAFFNDFRREPDRGFTYFENTGSGFRSRTTPLTSSGRWLILESADLTNDGYNDLILGALNSPEGVDPETLDKWRSPNTPFLFLRNVGRD